MEVVLKHSGRWLRFSEPNKILRAYTIEEVLPLLREAEESGLFVAGFESYEAASAFDHALKTHPGDGFPYLVLGLFNAPDVLDSIELCTAGSAQQDGSSDSASPSSLYEMGELIPSISRDEFT